MQPPTTSPGRWHPPPLPLLPGLMPRCCKAARWKEGQESHKTAVCQYFDLANKKRPKSASKAARLMLTFTWLVVALLTLATRANSYDLFSPATPWIRVNMQLNCDVFTKLNWLQKVFPCERPKWCARILVIILLWLFWQKSWYDIIFNFLWKKKRKVKTLTVVPVLAFAKQAHSSQQNLINSSPYCLIHAVVCWGTVYGVFCYLFIFLKSKAHALWMLCFASAIYRFDLNI